MDGKVTKPSADRVQSKPPTPVYQPQKGVAGLGPAALRSLQSAADNASDTRKLRQLKKLAYLRHNASALRQLSGDERRYRQLMRRLAGR